MFRQTSVRSLAIVVAIAASSLVAVSPAVAGGGPAANTRQILRHALIATVLQRSVHVDGWGSINATETNKGITVFLGAKATYQGDAEDWNKPKLNLSGHFKAVAVEGGYHLTDVGQEGAARVGTSAWQCTSLKDSAGSSSTTPAEMTAAKAIGKWLRALGRKVKLTNLGSSTYNGVPVWDIQMTLHTRLNLKPLLAINSVTVTPAVRRSVQHMLQPVQKLPRPWVNMKVNLWISQLRYTLQRVALNFRIHAKSATVTMKMATSFTNYGEKAAISLPAKCRSHSHK